MNAVAVTLYRTLLALALALLLLVASDAPAAAQIAVIGSTVIERVAAPGESYAGAIVVRNLTRTHQPVRIYQTDYLFAADGTSRFDPVGTTERSNAKWVTPAQRSLLIPPSGELTLSYSVTVPASDSLVGSYWSTIMVEAAPVDAAPSSSDKAQVGLGAVVRYAIQVATHIRANGSRKVSFSNARVVVDPDSTQTFELDVANAGERAHRPTMWIEVYDEQGALRAKVRQERGLLYPGTSLRQRFRLGQIAAGAYRAIVFADSGDDAVFAAQFTLRF